MPETDLPEHDDVDRSGRRPPVRLPAGLAKPTRGQLVVALLLALVGFAGITQVQSHEADDRYAGLREQDLIDVLNGLAGTTQRAQSEIARLEATRDDLLSDTNARQTALTQAQEQAAALRILAGLVPVTGPGIRVTVKELEGRVRIDSMIDMVQELRTAGAEAMQINGQVRVVAQTSFEDTEGGLLVSGQLLSPPYVVDVIGDPDTLAGAITFRAGPSDQLEQAGAEVTLDQLDLPGHRERRRGRGPRVRPARPVPVTPPCGSGQ